jgi:ABC-type multidrug transport system ATPase subunit
MAAIHIEGLRKTYDGGKVQALRGLDLRVDSGELFGLIGPDGAGKTSLLRILATLLLPEAGSARIGEWDVVQHYALIRRNVGYMPGRFSLYQDLTVRENLAFFASVFKTRIEDNYELIRDIFVQLEPFQDRRAGALSGGMKQKLALSCALIHRPRLLLLDEPTTGVDAVSRREFWDMLHHIRSQGITVVVSTPYMNEANRCDRVALMQDGQVMAIDTPAGIVDSFRQPLWALRHPRLYPLLLALRRHPLAGSVHPFGENLHLTLQPDAPPDLAPVLAQLAAEGFAEVDARRIAPEIEDCFMALMTANRPGGAHSTHTPTA